MVMEVAFSDAGEEQRIPYGPCVDPSEEAVEYPPRWPCSSSTRPLDGRESRVVVGDERDD